MTQCKQLYYQIVTVKGLDINDSTKGYQELSHFDSKQLSVVGYK
jgi:hypothetical protein